MEQVKATGYKPNTIPEVYLLVFGAEEGQDNVVKIYADIGDAVADQDRSIQLGLAPRLFRGRVVLEQGA